MQGVGGVRGLGTYSWGSSMPRSVTRGVVSNYLVWKLIT